MVLFRKFLFGFLTAFLLVVLGNFQTQAKPAFWKLEDEDTTIYILGTFHILQKETVWYTHEMDDALRASDALYLELAPEDNSASATWEYVRAKGFFRDGVYLSDHLGEREFYRVQELISMAGGSPAIVFRMKPWFAAAALSGQQAVAQGFERFYGVEEVLLRRARKFRKPVRGMESVDVQLRALAEYPLEMQTRYLRAVISMVEKDLGNAEDLSRAWVKGDLQTISESISVSLEGFPVMEERVLFERNRNWVAKIKNMMDSPGTFFIAVGTAHLTGPENVIALLEKENLTPKRQ